MLSSYLDHNCEQNFAALLKDCTKIEATEKVFCSHFTFNVAHAVCFVASVSCKYNFDSEPKKSVDVILP